MYRFALLVVAVTLLSGSVAQAASYEMTSGTIVDPILDTSGNTHPYSGGDLEPNAGLANADLSEAYLHDAVLTGADLTGTTFTGAQDLATARGNGITDE